MNFLFDLAPLAFLLVLVDIPAALFCFVKRDAERFFLSSAHRFLYKGEYAKTLQGPRFTCKEGLVHPLRYLT
jgi:hypothetical protein